MMKNQESLPSFKNQFNSTYKQDYALKCCKHKNWWAWLIHELNCTFLILRLLPRLQAQRQNTHQDLHLEGPEGHARQGPSHLADHHPHPPCQEPQELLRLWHQPHCQHQPAPNRPGQTLHHYQRLQPHRWHPPPQVHHQSRPVQPPEVHGANSEHWRNQPAELYKRALLQTSVSETDHQSVSIPVPLRRGRTRVKQELGNKKIKKRAEVRAAFEQLVQPPGEQRAWRHAGTDDQGYP